MSTTSQKAQNFVSEPMGEKPVTAIAGIGETLGKRLEESGFELACTLFGQFLLLKGDKELFCAWLKDTCGANAKQATDCHNCLAEWKDQFM